MQNLAGNSNDITAELMQKLWLQRLPHNMKAILSISSEKVNKLMVMAMVKVIKKISLKSQEVSYHPQLESQRAGLPRQLAELKSAAYLWVVG